MVCLFVSAGFVFHKITEIFVGSGAGDYLYSDNDRISVITRSVKIEKDWTSMFGWDVDL